MYIRLLYIEAHACWEWGWPWVVRVLSIGWDVLGKGRGGLGGGWDGLDKGLGGGWEIARTPPISGAGEQ